MAQFSGCSVGAATHILSLTSLGFHRDNQARVHLKINAALLVLQERFPQEALEIVMLEQIAGMEVARSITTVVATGVIAGQAAAILAYCMFPVEVR